VVLPSGKRKDGELPESLSGQILYLVLGAPAGYHMPGMQFVGIDLFEIAAFA
jgi:hypothetical protein